MTPPSYIYTIIIGLVSTFGIAINGYIIFVIIKEKQVKSANGMLLVQHSAVELALSVCVIVCSLVPNIFDDAHNQVKEVSNNAYCHLCGFLMSSLRPVALWTVCALNCDRYYAISAPLHYGSLINSRKVLIAMSLTWLSSLVLTLPIIIIMPFTYTDQSLFCAPNPKLAFPLYYLVGYITLVFILPLFVILVCNAKIFTIARHHKHRIASAIFEVTLSAQVTITHQKNPFSPSGLANRFKGRSASLTVFQIVGSFVIIYVPYYATVLWGSITLLLNQSGDDQQPKSHQLISTNTFSASVISTATILLFCSSPVNGLLYGVKNKVLKKCFRNYWRKKMTKNELNQEIQARTPSTCGSRRPSLTPAVGIAFFTRQSCRRTSDISVDTQKSNLLGTSFSRFQYNNLTWRPGSSPGLETSVPHNDSFNELKRTHSLRRSMSNHVNNSLSSLRSSANSTATPSNGGTNELGLREEPPGHPFNALHRPATAVKNGKPSVLMGGSGTTLLLQRFRKNDPCDYEMLNHRGRSKSPKILITRAYSEENDSTTVDRSCPPKTSSSVTTLLIDSHGDSLSKECFGVISRHPLLTDNTTDESGSDESHSHSNDELCAKTKNGHTTSHLSSHNLKSWPFTGRRKNIQFRIGSVVLSESDFVSDNYDKTNNPS